MIKIIDSHTEGEPTRVVISGGPDLGNGTMQERREIFQNKYDAFRTTVINEPRGNDVLVGALLQEPVNPENTAGVIYFNNAGCLWMCGHATIGLLVTLAYMGRIQAGIHTIETPVGNVEAELLDDHTVKLRNVPAYRYKKGFVLNVNGVGPVIGDIAWGGNWFFLVSDHPYEINLKNVDELVHYTWEIKKALEEQEIVGSDGAAIDHVEIFTDPDNDSSDSKNFVMCPGKVYDRSPCGTGTSAKLSCLAEDGKLARGEIWRQAGILNSVFEASYELVNGEVIPSIKGTAFITSESTLICQDGDPFKQGISYG